MVLEHWWNDAGALVEWCWSIGGMMLEHWWNGAGALVE
jgi:hypothetical protein